MRYLIYLMLLFSITQSIAQTSSTFSQPANERRVALVIGNGDYKTKPLKNPANDAADVATKLRTFGFKVIERKNLTSRQIGSTLNEFRVSLSPGSTAIVFYAGHGVQIRGENYLPTVDAVISSEEDVPTQSLAVRQIMDVLAEANTSLNLIFLDSCRDNPYARSLRSTAGGLARINAPSGTLISFATRPGSVASDGDGRNGVYTAALLEQMNNTQQPIEQLLKRVVTRVKTVSKGNQEPWMEGSIEGDFCFGRCTQAIAPPLAQLQPQPQVRQVQTKKAEEKPPVKKSRSGICHPPGGDHYAKTKNFIPYKTMDECIKSGGRPPKG